MVRITDITLSCLDDVINNDSSPEMKKDLLNFLCFLIGMEVDAIEISDKMCALLSPLPEYPAYIIQYKKVRITGLDDAMCGDYQQAFDRVKNSYDDDAEFCPSDHFHCATALAAEWIISGAGNNVASSFCGIGSFAATEELIMILRMEGIRKTDKTYEFLPEMTKLFSKIIGRRINKNKPVIGRDIFHVESGIHVDGILKQPECYEPFPPKLVGQKRKIILGKMSGKASICRKLKSLDIQCSQADVLYILEQVKTKAALKNSAIGKNEFREIVQRCQA